MSLTPLAVERDSRAYRIAASFARMGARSIVVEAESSNNLGVRVPFEVVVAGANAGSAANERPPPLGRVASIAHSIRELFAAEVSRPWRALPSADVYYAHSYRQFPGLLLRRGFRRTPIILDVHDFSPWILVNQPSDRLFARFVFAVYRAQERLAIRSARAVVTVSEGVAALLREHYGVDPIVIRNTHDARLDTSDAPSLRTQLNLEADAFLLVMIGGSNHADPMTAAVRALTLLPSTVHLAFVGSGHQENLHALAAELGLSSRLHLPGQVHPAAVVPSISDADALFIALIPDRHSRHALPNKLFQGVAAGLPLLHSNELDELTQLAGDAGISVVADDPGSIAAGVRRLLDDPTWRERCRTASRELHESANWTHDEKRLFDLVGDVLAT